MIANYHTHTPLCLHAEGDEEDYVRFGLENGLQILGFSDHTPYPFPEGYRNPMRMLPEELPAYANGVRQLQKAYAGKLEIHLGLEVEYYPDLFPELLPMIRDQGIEYMLLGQHWCGNEMGQPYNGRPSDSEEKLQQYCDQSIAALETGLFTYFAHPDLIRFTGEDEVYRRHMVRICKAAKANGIPLEINLLGIRQGRNYPDLRFWELAAVEGCTVIFGCDAHLPEHTVDAPSEQVALEMVQRLGLPLLNTVSFRKI